MKLLPHQQKALELTEGFNRCAYYYDMGLGKTFIGSEKMERLHETVNLVVCQKSKIDDWIEHFVRYYRMAIYDLTGRQDLEDFMEAARMRCDRIVGIINYDLLFRRPELLKLEYFTLMLDESSLIQNTSAKRTKFVLKMHYSNVILLSGTPTSGRYERLWSQLHLLGWPISKKLYEQQFVEWDFIENWNTGYRIPVVKGYKNVDRLKSKMAEYGCIFMKTEEAIDLPEQQFMVTAVDAPKEYKKFMKTRYIELDGIEFAGSTSLTTRLYAREICGAYNKEKLAAVKDLIDSTEDRLIIFYNFSMELEKLVDLAGDRPISIVNGKIKNLKAYEEDSDSITFIQYQAGAYGLNLQKAQRIIYYSLPESSEMFEQSKKRIHRIGQTQTCFYYIMLTRESIEEKILTALRLRKDYTDDLFRKKYWLPSD